MYLVQNNFNQIKFLQQKFLVLFQHIIFQNYIHQLLMLMSSAKWLAAVLPPPFMRDDSAMC